MNDNLSLIYNLSRAVWRKRWTAVATAWIVAAVVWMGVLVQPDRYEATARVFVDSRTALRPMLEGIAIQDDTESQLALVREAMLSRPQLEAVAHATKLDANVQTPADMEAVVSSLQSQIEVTSELPADPTTRQGTRNAVYTISYQHTNRDKSIEVVKTLLASLVEGTLQGNLAGSSAAQSFLLNQISELEKRLQDAEQRLAEFKKRNIGLIPGEQGDYFTRLNLQMTGLQQAETDLAVAYSRRSELQRQLASTQRYMPGTGAATVGGNAVGTLDVTLRRQEAEQNLEALLLRYTDRHPEVLGLRRTIADLKEREARELAELQRGGAGTGSIRSLNANPLYQQTQSALNEVQVNIASLLGAAEQHRQEIAELRKYVDKAPEVEQEFARLNRDYTATREQYDQFVTRREQARVSDDAARSGNVRFNELEPPSAPLDPSSPKRKPLFIAGLLLALAAGVALALLPRLLVPTFDDAGSIEKALGLPVIGSVSMQRTAEQRAALKGEVRTIWLLGIALVLATAVLVSIGGGIARLMHPNL